MKKSVIICLFIQALAAAAMAQNVGINTTNPQAALDVNGDMVLRSADLASPPATSVINPLDVNTVKRGSYRITGPTANFSIAGITAGADGRVISLFNGSAANMVLTNENGGAAAANRIRTSTGANITLFSGGSIDLQYYAAFQRWQVNGGYNSSESIGGGGIGWADNGTNSIYNTNPGNVGIGTQYPGYKLHVAGNGYYYGDAATRAAVLQGSSYFIGGGLQVGTPNLENFGAGIEGNFLSIDGNRLQAFVRRLDDGSVSDYPRSLGLNMLGGAVMMGGPVSMGGSVTMVGPIGMGTTSPLNNAATTIQTVDGSYAMVIRNPSSSVRFETYVGGPTNGNAISLGTPGSMPIAIYTNGANRMFISAAGNVGIGTDNPTFKLSVNGNIRAKELRINTGWADYVFEDGYQLPPLAEVEQHIKQYKHLPGIPAAAVLQQEGVDVSDMQTRMMAKIEELTLYLIEAYKRIEQLTPTQSRPCKPAQ
jgi:hypothetical protein